MESTRIADLLLSVFQGEPWHGPSTTALLADVTADAAARRPAAAAHSIWEIVLHMTGWAEEVRQRLGGRPAQDPDGGDWPAVGPVSAEAWQAARARLAEAHHALVDAVRALPDDVLGAAVTDFRHAPGESGSSHYQTLHGLVHHTAYHSGQIGLLKAAHR